MTFVLTTSSTADMTKEYLESRNIPYTPFTYIIDEVEYPDDLGQTMSYEEFYARIDKGAMPTTSQVNVQAYIDLFTPFLEEGKDILHLELSSGISSSVQSMLTAKGVLEEKYPDRVLSFHDSLSASSGLGLLLDMVADLRDQGVSIQDADRWVEENKLNIQQWFFTSDLTHLKRGGRVSAASAAVGGLLNICPLMIVDAQGKLTVQAKIRGKKKTMVEAVNRMKALVKDGTSYDGKVFLSHSRCEEDALTLKELVQESFPNVSEYKIMTIGSVIGAHTGPGTVTLFYYGAKRG